MITWILLLPAAVLFMAINVIVGCYIAIWLGYGPPDWKTALNLVIRVTTLQDWLNTGRDWLDKKAPWADKLLNRLHIPKPIIIVERLEEKDTADETSEMHDEAIGDTATEQTEEFAEVSVNGLLDKLEPHTTESEPVPPGESAKPNENQG